MAWRFSINPSELITLLDKDECDNPACHRSDDYAVDHDHRCCPGNYSCGNCIRGVLCRGCNTALGGINDQIDKLAGLTHYVSKNEFLEFEKYEPAYKESTKHKGRYK
jgi:hypothetical protein